MRKFFGREHQLEKLDALWRKSTSSFVVIAGRRRIGKSTLVEEFAARSQCEFIELVGLAPDAKSPDAAVWVCGWENLTAPPLMDAAASAEYSAV